MRILQANDHVVEIVLSERNVETLLKLLSTPDVLPVLHRNCEDGVHLSVRIEPDEAHYADRDHGSDPHWTVKNLLSS